MFASVNALFSKFKLIIIFYSMLLFMVSTSIHFNFKKVVGAVE